MSLGINPGGEVKAIELGLPRHDAPLCPYELERLYTKAEIEAMDEVVPF